MEAWAICQNVRLDEVHNILEYEILCPYGYKGMIFAKTEIKFFKILVLQLAIAQAGKVCQTSHKYWSKAKRVFYPTHSMSFFWSL